MNGDGIVSERVAVESRLDHDEDVGHGFSVEIEPEEGSFIRGIVEELDEDAASQVEHELMVQAHFLRD